MNSLSAYLRTRFSVKSLTQRIFITFSSMVMIPLIISGAYIYHNYTKNFEEESYKHVEDFVHKLNADLDKLFSESNSALISLWLNEDMQALLSMPSKDWSKNTTEYFHLSQNIKTILGWRSGAAGLFVVTSDGGVMNELTSNAVNKSYPFADTPFYHKAQSYYDAFLTGPEPQSYVQGKPVFSITRALFSGPYRTWSGIIRLDYETSVISSLFESVDHDRHSVYFAVDSDNRIVYHPDASLIGTQLDSRLVQSMTSAANHSVSFRGQTYIAAAQTSKLTGWTTIGMLPETVVHQEGTGMLKPLYLIGGLSLLIVLIAAVLLSAYILKPLQKINGALRKLGQGNFALLESDPVPTELTMIVDRYNLSITKLKALTEDLIRKQEAELREKEAELIQLQAQMNPHFLYNTLSCIDSMAEQEGQSRIRSVIGSLSELLRASMSGRERMVTLQEELQLVLAFVYIQKERHGERIEVEWQIAEEALEWQIPKLTIQPLVENAYFHGVEPNLGKGLIRVEAQLLEEQLMITVQDNGIGMEPPVLEGFRTFIASGGAVPRAASMQRYSGLENVIRRLLLTYGERCEVFVESEPYEGTIVKVRIAR